MKLLFFDNFKLGVLKGDAVIDVSDAVRGIPHTGPHNLISALIERFGEYQQRLQELVERERGVPVSQVRIRPPLPRPSNIVCMAVNYMEDGTRAEPAPINAFLKSPSAVIGDGDTMVLPDAPASRTRTAPGAAGSDRTERASTHIFSNSSRVAALTGFIPAEPDSAAERRIYRQQL